MGRRDARSLDHATLEELRRQAVRQVLDGEARADVAERLEVHPGTVAKWMMRYHRDGEAALAARKAPGPVPKLTARQQQQLATWIIGRTPEQFRFPFALWTLPLIGQLIEQKFGVVLHATTIARLLHRLGLSPQRPIRRAFKRDAAACLAWATKEFPALVRQVQKRQAVLLFADETGVHADGPVARTWGRRGQPPVVAVSGTRARVNVLSAISPRGRLWFRCFTGTLTGARFVAFLRALRRDVRGEIFLIVDRHPAHTAAVTRRFLHAHAAHLHVAYLPAYAPDLNPDEHVWAHLKGLFRREPLAKDEHLGRAVQKNMALIRADRDLVRAFFDHPAVAYVKQALRW